VSSNLSDQNFSSDFLQQSKLRGFIYQGTDITGLDRVMKTQSIGAYLGFDATAKSLHVGSLVGIMWLRLLQKTGHKPIVLMGGATSKIGDPTFKDVARKMLTDEEVQDNINGIKKVFDRFIKFGDGPTDAIMVNNDDWLSGINYLEFLREYGPHFTINRMIAMDSVRQRLERQSPLSFLEFNYMILQAYDFLHLNRNLGCKLQLGGSDQWSNIINGVELVRRFENDESKAFGLTTPLVTTAGGAKMGKTTQGAVWLNADMLPPYDYWQFWRNTDDRDVGRYLKLFTDLPLDEISRLESLQGSEINDAKKILADEATSLAHGKECLEAIHGAVSQLFGGASSSNVDLLTIDLMAEDLPTTVENLLVKAGLTQSKGEGKRLIQGGGVRINDQAVNDGQMPITPQMLGEGKIKLSVGKKKHVYVKMAIS